MAFVFMEFCIWHHAFASVNVLALLRAFRLTHITEDRHKLGRCIRLAKLLVSRSPEHSIMCACGQHVSTRARISKSKDSISIYLECASDPRSMF